MKRIVVTALSLFLLATALAVPPSASRVAPTEPVGGARYFLCAAFQTLKYGGLIAGRPDAVLVGALGSGLACGFGW